MAASAQYVANQFLASAKSAGRSLTNMQLQKLVFLAQGYSLGITGAPAYYNNTHAWQWGPVIPKLYKELQQYGSGQVLNPVRVDDESESLEEPQKTILSAVWNGYKDFSGSQLSSITHRPGSPWSNTWETNKFGIIPVEDIREYYKRMVSKP